MPDFELTPEERKHIANHLVGFDYTSKASTKMSLSLLLRLGYHAELKEVSKQERFEPDMAEWWISCKELDQWEFSDKGEKGSQ